jgi:hypothetical protein
VSAAAPRITRPPPSLPFVVLRSSFGHLKVIAYRFPRGNSMNRVAFFGGIALVIVGLAMWVLRPNSAAQKNTIKIFGAEFTLDTPALAVMVLGIVMMLLSPRFEGGIFPDPPPPLKKIVCTGQIEDNCPGAHDIFYLCGYFGSDKQIADGICHDLKSGFTRLKTTDGNRCGYSLIEVTCK